MASQSYPFYLFWACLWFGRGLASFNLYPGVSANKLAQSLNITSACVEALNQTITECDQTLLQMTQSLENYWWTDDNLTDVCTSGCAGAVSQWNGDAAAACDEQYFTAYGRLVPIWTVTERFVDNVNFACLESWSDNFTWCLTESQTWVGADVLRADCDTDPSDPTCSGDVTAIPEDSIRMANLYEDDILCNNCFINQLYSRVTSDFLPNSDHSDYLVDQLFDIQDVCNITLPDFTLRLLDWYDTAPPLTSTDLGSTSTASATTSAPTSSTTCLGQSVGGSTGTKVKKWDSPNRVRGSAPVSGAIDTRQDASSCDALSQQYGVTTGALQWFSDSDTCAFTSTACLPLACSLQQVASGDTCTSIAASIGGDTTLAQFMKWNPYILGLCDSLTEGQYVCITSPGTTGTFTLPAPPLGTDADANNQQRGGAGGIVTPTTTVTTTADPVSGGSAPSPTQDGLVTNCNNYASATAGQGCYDFATGHNILPTQLYAWNPVLGLDGTDCTTALWASEYYCIGTWTATSTAPATAPGPTQTGITSDCNKYASAISGDGCEAFAARNSITTAELYAWNSVLGADGANCGTSLWADEYYCVGVAAPASSTTPAATTTTTKTSSSSSTAVRVTAPGPTQTGIVASCNKYAEATGGIGCYDFATNNGITPTQLYTWNPVLGSNGENCGSSFWADEYYCVGVSS